MDIAKAKASRALRQSCVPPASIVGNAATVDRNTLLNWQHTESSYSSPMKETSDAPRGLHAHR